MLTEYVITKPKKEKWAGSGMISQTPGLRIEVSSDESLVELSHYYENGTTSSVGITTEKHSAGDELQKVIEILQDIKKQIR